MKPWPDPRDDAPVRRWEIWLASLAALTAAALTIWGWLPE